MSYFSKDQGSSKEKRKFGKSAEEFLTQIKKNTLQDEGNDLYPLSMEDEINDVQNAQSLRNDERSFLEAKLRARSDALFYVGVDNKTTGRTREHLFKKGYSNETVEQVIMELVEEGYLDDNKLALSIIRKREGRRGESLRMLEKRLINRGVSRTVAQDVLMKYNQSDRDLARLYFSTAYEKQIIEIKKSESWLIYGFSPYKNEELSVLIKKGLQRGFSYTIIMDVLQELIEKNINF